MLLPIILVVILSMMITNRIIVVKAVTTTTISNDNNEEDGMIHKSWILYHWVGTDYIPRNKIIMQIKKKEPVVASSSSSSSLDTDKKNDRIQLTIEPIRIIEPHHQSINTDDPNRFVNSTIVTKEMISQFYQPNSFYQLKIVEDEDDEEEDTADHHPHSRHVVYTSVPSCTILRSNYRDEITLTLNSYGTILSFHYIPLMSSFLTNQICEKQPPLDHDDDHNKNTTTQKEWMTSRITYEIAVQGMNMKNVLSGTQYKPPVGLKRIPNSINPYPILQRMQQQGTTTSIPQGASTTTSNPIFPEDAKGQNGQGQPPTGGIMGFFRKYWYIIVPMMIFNLLSGTNPPQMDPSQQQQQQQQYEAASRGQLPSAGVGRSPPTPTNNTNNQNSSSTSSSSAARKRRGKRD
jgi:hypothetical protein